MIERAEQFAKSINEAHWCTDGLSFEEVISRLILRELQEERKMAVDEACEWFGNYLMEIGYPDDWMRDSKVQSSGEQRFRKAMLNE